MYYEIVKVKHIKDYCLEVEFENGEKGTVDLSEYTQKGGVFAPLKEIEFFKQVFIHPDFGVLSWSGDIDIAPETIYIKATGKSLKKVV
jgi:hypothetical protein